MSADELQEFAAAGSGDAMLLAESSEPSEPEPEAVAPTTAVVEAAQPDQPQDEFQDGQQEQKERPDEGEEAEQRVARSSARKRRRVLDSDDDLDDDDLLREVPAQSPAEGPAEAQSAAATVPQADGAGDPLLLYTQIERIMHADMISATLKSVRETLRSDFGYSKTQLKELKPQIKSICGQVAQSWRPQDAAEDEDEDEDENVQQPKRKRLRRTKPSGKDKKPKKAVKEQRPSESEEEEEEDEEEQSSSAAEDSDAYEERRRRGKAKTAKRHARRHHDEDDEEEEEEDEEDDMDQDYGSSRPRKKGKTGPKRARSAYTFFVSANRPSLRQENPDLSFGEVAKLLGERWRHLSATDRIPYEEQAQEDKQRYQVELRRWKIEHPEEAAAASASRKRKTASSSSASRKQRSANEDGEYQDSADPGEYEAAGEPSEFDKLLNSLKRSKPKPRSNIEEVRGEAEFFVKRMIAAWQSDLRAYRAGQPAIHRMSMLKEVAVECGKQVLQEHLMDTGLLKAINLWLKPFGGKDELPNINLRRPLYQLLAKLPIDESHLLNSDGLGKRINKLWQREEPKSPERTMLQQLLEKWMRPVVGSVTDYKKLEVMERKLQKDMLDRRRAIRAADEKLKPSYTRSSIAHQTTFDFLVRPESKISFEDAEEEARGAQQGGAAELKRQLKRAVMARPKAHHVTVSVTGSKKRKL